MDSKLSCISFQTNEGHSYIMSQTYDQFFYLHPIVYYFYIHNIEQKNDITPDNLIYPIEIGGQEYNQTSVEYYYNKFQFFNKQKIFSSIQREALYKKKINTLEAITAVTETEQLAIELIQNCNLKCQYCLYGDIYKTKFKHHVIEFDKLKAILDFLADYWSQRKRNSRKIRINYYGGEPLLKFDVIVRTTEYLKSISKKIDLEFEFGLTTNGVLLDDKKIQYFVENNFFIAISLDGNKANNSYRVYKKTGDEVYDDVIQNVEQIKKYDSNYFINNVHFISVLHNRNSIDDINNFFKGNYEKNHRQYGALNKIDVKPEKQQEFDSMYVGISNDADFKIGSRKFNLIREKDKLNKHYTSFKKNLISKRSYRLYTGTCIPLQKKIFITADYNLMPCERISFDVNFGNLYENGKHPHINWAKIIKVHNTQLSSVTQQCAKCYYNSLCSTCIYTFKKDKHGKPICDSFMNKLSMQKYLKEIFSLI